MCQCGLSRAVQGGGGVTGQGCMVWEWGRIDGGGGCSVGGLGVEERRWMVGVK